MQANMLARGKGPSREDRRPCNKGAASARLSSWLTDPGCNFGPNTTTLCPIKCRVEPSRPRKMTGQRRQLSQPAAHRYSPSAFATSPSASGIAFTLLVWCRRSECAWPCSTANASTAAAADAKRRCEKYQPGIALFQDSFGAQKLPLGCPHGGTKARGPCRP